MERQFSPEEQALYGLYQQILGLSDDAEVAGRFILQGPDGSIVAHGSLSRQDIAAATEAIACLIAARNAMQAELGDQAGQLAPQPAANGLPAPTVAVDPHLEAELEEYCVGLDTEHLMQVASQDPKGAVAEFDEIVSQWDGDL